MTHDSCLFWCLCSPRFGPVEPFQSMFWIPLVSLVLELGDSSGRISLLWNGWSGVFFCLGPEVTWCSFLNRKVPWVPPIIWGEAFCWCCFSSPVTHDFSDCAAVFLDDAPNRCPPPFGTETGTGWATGIFFSEFCSPCLCFILCCCRCVHVRHVPSRALWARSPHRIYCGSLISTREKLLNLKWVVYWPYPAQGLDWE